VRISHHLLGHWNTPGLEGLRPRAVQEDRECDGAAVGAADGRGTALPPPRDYFTKAIVDALENDEEVAARRA